MAGALGVGQLEFGPIHQAHGLFLGELRGRHTLDQRRRERARFVALHAKQLVCQDVRLCADGPQQPKHRAGAAHHQPAQRQPGVRSKRGFAAAIAAAVAAGANTYMPKQNSGSISNLLMSAGPSNVNLADVNEGMLRIPSMPRISSVGDLVKRTISSEALANFEQQQAAIAAQMASGAAGLMAGGAQQNGASKDGASPRGFVPFRAASYQNLLEAAKLAESAEKEKKNNAKKGAAAAASKKLVKEEGK